MGLKEDVIEMKKEVEEIKEESLFMELLKEDHRKNKRQFIIILVLIGLLVLETTYLFYLKDDIGITTDTIEIEDVENIDSSTIKIGDEYGESKIN